MLKRILKISAGVIILLTITLYFTYDYWLEKELKFQLSEIINKDPNSLYEYSFSKLNIHLMEGSVDLKGITIKPTESAFDSLADESNGLRFLLHLNMKEIELNGFEITEFLTTGKIIVESLIISEPNFEYFFHPRKKQSKQAMPLNNVFSDKFNEANLGKFYILNGNVKIVDQTKSGPAIVINHINFELTEAHIDRITLKRFSPFDYQDIKVEGAGISINASENFSITSDSLIFKIEDETFALKNFQIKPKYSQENFAKKYDVQKQWFAITLDSLILNQINFDEFVHTGIIDIGKVEIISPNIALYKDKSKPPPPFKKKLLPASAIKAIPWTVKIDSVVIEKGYVSINETSPNTGNKSHLTFNKLNGLLLNFTNDSAQIRESPFMQLMASTMVLDKALTKINLRFNLNSKTDEFKASGTVGKVSGETFNTVLEPMMAIKVTGGMINSISFSFTAMDTISIGTLDADYKGMKLEVLSKDLTKKKQGKKGLMSFAANTFIKSNNHKGQSNYVQGIIRISRVQEKDVWPYLWHSIQAGLVTTLVPINKSEEVKRQQKKVRKDLRKDRKANK